MMLIAHVFGKCEKLPPCESVAAGLPSPPAASTLPSDNHVTSQ